MLLRSFPNKPTRPKSAKTFGVLIAGALALGFAQIGASAADETQDKEPMELSMPGRTLQLEPDSFDDALASESVRFQISGPDPQNIKIELLDFVVAEDGAKSLLPAGSTAHSLEGIVSIGEYETDYVPNGNEQSFEARLTAIGPGDDVKFGGVRVSMTPKSNQTATESLSGVSGVLMIVLVVPAGFDGQLPSIGSASIESGPIKLKPLFAENLFETLLPDIPGVVNRGPISAEVSATNQSMDPAFLTTSWIFRSDSDVLLADSSEKSLAFPGSAIEAKMALVAKGSGSTKTLDLLSPFTVYEVRAITEASLGANTLDSTSQSTKFIVLRWKEPVGVLLCLLIVGFMLWRTQSFTNPEISETEGLEQKPS